MRKASRSRKAEKFVRLAYELEADAAALREAGWTQYGERARDISSQIGKLGRSMRGD